MLCELLKPTSAGALPVLCGPSKRRRFMCCRLQKLIPQALKMRLYTSLPHATEYRIVRPRAALTSQY